MSLSIKKLNKIYGACWPLVKDKTGEKIEQNVSTTHNHNISGIRPWMSLTWPTFTLLLFEKSTNLFLLGLLPESILWTQQKLLPSLTGTKSSEEEVDIVVGVIPFVARWEFWRLRKWRSRCFVILCGDGVIDFLIEGSLLLFHGSNEDMVAFLDVRFCSFGASRSNSFSVSTVCCDP